MLYNDLSCSESSDDGKTLTLVTPPLLLTISCCDTKFEYTSDDPTNLIKARLTRGDLSGRFFHIHARLLCKFLSDEI